MISDRHRPILKIKIHKLGQMGTLTAQWHLQHLVEIAIVDISPPIDTDEVAAHDTFNILILMGLT